LSTTASVAVSVLPSPVRISAIDPAMEHHAADQLHVEVAHTEPAFADPRARSRRSREAIVEALAVPARARSASIRSRSSASVSSSELGLVSADQRDALLVALEHLALADVQCAVDEGP